MKLTPIVYGFALGCCVTVLAEPTPQSPFQRITGWHYLRSGEPLVWLGPTPPSDAENQALLAAIDAVQTNRWPTGLSALEKFTADYPQSPWLPSLRANLAYEYYFSGRYTLALQHWQAVWAETKSAQTGPAKRIADFTLAFWTRLLASLGRTETLIPLIDQNKDRILDRGGLSQVWAKTRAALVDMTRHPELCYKCGTFALQQVAHQTQITYDVRSLLGVPSPGTGFSLQSLSDLSARLNLHLVPVKRVQGTEIVVPSVVHWSQNHYAAIVSRAGTYFRVVDTTFGKPRIMDAETINAEASGYFLIPETQISANFAPVSANEASSVFGRGQPQGWDDSTDQKCPDDDSDCSCPDPFLNNNNNNNNNNNHHNNNNNNQNNNNPSPSNPPTALNEPPGLATCGCHGMPVWSVSEPWINIWLEDEPLGYQPAVGPRVSFKLFYKQRQEYFNSPWVSGLGGDWNCTWLSAIDAANYFQSGNFDNFSAYFLGGGAPSYDNSELGSSNYFNSQKMLSQTNSLGTLTNIELIHADGAIDMYGHIPASQNFCFLSAKISPEGYVTRFIYDDSVLPSIQLKYVVDANNGTNTLYYDTSTSPATLTQVTDPYGRSIYLKYDTTGSTPILTNIVDTASLTNSFIYNELGWLTNLTTPYGQTSFQPVDTIYTNVDNRDRWVTVTQPDGGHQLFYFTLGNGLEPIAFPAALVPTNTPVGTLDNDPENLLSYHWGPRQYANLSTNDVNYMSYSDFLKARMCHWLGLAVAGPTYMNTLSFERDPSPDSVNYGQITWYDYLGKVYASDQGTTMFPNVVAQVLPDGSTWYQFIERNSSFWPTNVSTTYTLPDGTIGTRTNKFVYATNNIDRLQLFGPDGALLAGYSYNGNHQVLSFTNAVGDVTRYTYNNIAQLTSVMSPMGLTTTNVYFSSGSSSNWLQQTSDEEINRVNSYTYTNALVFTHTDERGLTVTNTWDTFQRLLRTDYPDGTFVTNSYLNLDLVRVQDRMGFSTSYFYDSLRRLTAVTNAMGRATLYNYCTCGSLDSIRDALGNFTHFYFDNAGRTTNVVYADGFGITNFLDLLGRITNAVDSAGSSVTNWFNNQGLFTGSSNAFGLLASRGYDIYDRVTNIIDANGVSLTNTFDYLGRLLTRTYPDTANEKFGYAPAGLVAYTNQLGFTNFYAYDAAGRKTFATNANGELMQFQYSPAGDLTNLVDGKNQSTKWGYDAFGRATNKVDNLGNTLFLYIYDADNRLTNRWTPAKGTTVYAYDRVGNLTNVTYPVNAPLTIGYDPLNRLISMVDGIGSTYYSYDAAGQLLSEDGPWADDTVNYAYTNRLRASLTLLQPNASSWTQSYAYDAAKRFSAVTSAAGTFRFNYPSGVQGVVASILLPNGAYITNTYDGMTRMLSTRLLNAGASVLNSQTYGYDLAGEQLWETNTAHDFRNYAYDRIGQLVGGHGYESNAVTRLQEQLGYQYDGAHNLNWRTNNGFLEDFSVNSLNELTNVSRSATNMTVAGTTTSPATNVTVNGSTAALYADSTFALGGFALADGNNTFTAIAQDSINRRDTNSVTVNLPASATYSYDLNGNLLADGTRYFAYDDENQLLSVWVTNAWRSDFAYDALMRRRIRREYTWNLGAWLQTNEVRYIYDKSLVIQERDINNLPHTSYTRGRDIGGNLQGAAGIGGLLALSLSSAAATQHYYYHAGGTGNILALINSECSIAAKYSYDPFGNTLSSCGAIAGINVYGFSSKEIHAKTGMLYFGYRFYLPSLQRWLNRDPIHERGGVNLFAFVLNDPITRNDFYGLAGDPGYCEGLLNAIKKATDEINTSRALGEPVSASAEAKLAALEAEYAANCSSKEPPPLLIPIQVPVLDNPNQNNCKFNPPMWPPVPGPSPYPSPSFPGPTPGQIATGIGLGSVLGILGGILVYIWPVFAL